MPTPITETSISNRRRWPSTFIALRHRNFRLWFFGQMISLMGTWMQWVAQGWLVYELTGSELALGTVSLLSSLPTLFLMIPAGAMTDRVDKRALLLVTQTALMVLAFVLAYLAWSGALAVWHVGLLAFGVGLVNSFDAPARQAMIVEMVDDRRDLMNAVALNSTLFNAARVVGPSIGGVVLAGMGAAACFAVNGVTFLTAIGALWLMRLQSATVGFQHEPLLPQMVEGLQHIARNRILATMMALSAVSALFGFAYSTLLPAIAADVLGVDEGGLGALNAAVGIGALLGSLLVASLSTFRHKGALLTAGSLVYPVGLLVFGSSRFLPLSLGALALAGFAFVVQASTMNTLIQSLASDAMRGRVLSVYMLTFFGTAPFTALYAGSSAELLGPGAAVVLGAVIVLLFALGTGVLVPSLRRLTD